MFEETITVMRRLWTEPEVTFQGRYFQLQSVRLGLRPLQQPGVPLWLAGSGDNALRRVLRLGDGWLPISSSPDAFKTDWERLQVLGQEMGRDARDLHRCLYTTLNVNADGVQAERELRAFIESYYGISYEEQATSQRPLRRFGGTLRRMAQGVYCRWSADDRSPLRKPGSERAVGAICQGGVALCSLRVKTWSNQVSRSRLLQGR